MRQSRRTQRALEKALFGPEPPGARRRQAPRQAPQVPASTARPGDCPFCGDTCALRAGDSWTCPHCGVTYTG